MPSESEMKEYTRRYNEFLKDREKIVITLGENPRPKQLNDAKNKILDSAKKHGLKVDERRIYTPENIKTGSICRPWESEYNVPSQSWLYNKQGSCGKGCLCVDKGADRESLHILNSLNSINLEQVCDGSREHHPRTSKTPYIAFSYKIKNPDLDALKTACSSAKQIIVDDPRQPQRIENLCTGKKLSVRKT